MPNLASCPNDEKKTLEDGKTQAIPYPKKDFNCNPYGITSLKGLSQMDKAGVPDGPEDSESADDVDSVEKNVDKAKIEKACKGVKPFDTELYKPYGYKGECMKPPLI